MVVVVAVGVHAMSLIEVRGLSAGADAKPAFRPAFFDSVRDLLLARSAKRLSSSYTSFSVEDCSGAGEVVVIEPQRLESTTGDGGSTFSGFPVVAPKDRLDQRSSDGVSGSTAVFKGVGLTGAAVIEAHRLSDPSVIGLSEDTAEFEFVVCGGELWTLMFDQRETGLVSGALSVDERGEDDSDVAGEGDL